MRHTTRRLACLLTLSCLAFAGCASAAGPVPYRPFEGSHVDLKARMLAHLSENLVPYWLQNCVDREYGGYLTVLNRDGTMQSGEKMIVTQARQIWTFSRLWVDGYRDPRIRQAAEQGLEFFRRHFWDDEHEGWFWQVGRDGTLQDASKWTYGHAFVIYAMVEYYRAFGDPEALQLARTTFDVLERHAKDPANPGYKDFMTRDWQPDPNNNGHVKTMNTHLHLMEAFMELYIETQDPLQGKRLREMFDILVEKCYMPEHRCCIDGFYYDWSPARDGFFGERDKITSYGHNVEFAWLMQRAARVLGLPEERYRRIGLTLVDHALQYGWVEHEGAGAMCYEGPWDGAATNRVIEWWTQAETAVALDWAYRTTGEGRYLDALRKQIIWILERQADPVYGGWYSSLAEDGAPLSDAKSGIWHGAYHDVRACLNVGLGTWE